MCKGEKAVNNAVLCHSSRKPVTCELCSSKAFLYCQADDAYLCRACDKLVHGANFLAYRHIRCMLCDTCQNLTRRYLVGGYMKMLSPSFVIGSRGVGNDGCILNDHDSNYYCKALKRPHQFL